MKHWKKLLLIAICLPLILQGCDYAVLAPKGPVGEGIRNTLLITFFTMLLIVIPTLAMIIYFPYRYSHKHKNVDKTYQPEWDHSKKIELWAWGVPIITIIVLATITYIATHQQDPRKPVNNEKPLVINAIAFNYKWLFMYPEEGIASINEIYFPVNKNIEFHITSDGKANSFFIPRLGSQMYAMAGNNNELNLAANEIGVYEGQSANYSGYGFAQMKFKAHAVNDDDFNQWVSEVQNKGTALTMQTLKKWHQSGLELENYPKEPVPPTYFNHVNPGLFDEFIGIFRGVTK